MHRVPSSVEPVEMDPLQFRATCSCDRVNTFYVAVLSKALFGPENVRVVPQAPVEGFYWSGSSSQPPTDTGKLCNVYGVLSERCWDQRM